MAKPPTTINNIDSVIAEGDDITRATPSAEPANVEETRPIFKKYPESKIPISKKMGNLWKSRYDQGVSKLKGDGTHDSWDEAVAYYKNDQTNKRNRDDPDRPSLGPETQIADGAFSRTENVVFSNVSAIVPAIYAKNPDVSVQTSKGDEERAFALASQKLVRTILQKRTPPGVNLKPKARVGVVRTTLMNISYIEVGYTRREASSEAAMTQIDEIAQKLEKAKTQDEIRELEGQLEAMTETVDLLQPSGPWTRAVHPKDVILDTEGTIPDLTDCKWVMVKDCMSTAFINAVYRTKDPETQEWHGMYSPTHVVKRGSGAGNIAGHDEDITNFSLFSYEESKQGIDYGYDDERSYRDAQRTIVWRVYDITTRRIYMFAENDWKWPIWVWDDPYGLDDFYTLYPLAFHTDPEDIYARGEVSYYLDQQDELNMINSQISRMRWRISNQLVYNKRAVKDEPSIMSLVKPVKGEELVGIDIPEGMKVGDVIGAPPVPSVEYAQLFDKKSLFDAVDRVSGVSAILRNVEFRTNTTNRAIETYESSMQQRLDEKIDAIEEQIGRVGYAILCMCLQFMSQEEVARLIGVENAKTWPPNMSAREAQDSYSLTVTGGSSQKPTSKVRKMQAREAGQILGQFGANNPMAFYITLKMFARAYSDELVLEASDWEMINSFMEQQLAGAMQQQGGSAGSSPAQPQSPGAGGQSGGPPASPEGMLPQLEQLLQKMPEELRLKVGAAIAKGVPLTQILQGLQQASAGGQQPQSVQ